MTTIKKKFPYRAALVACNSGCHASGCTDGCIACGACVSACKFGAIQINMHGIAEVDPKQCIACGLCVKKCPQGIIHVHECANTIVVKCSNRAKGLQAKNECSVSCIACGICTKTCTTNAIQIVDNHAVIAEELCLSCGMCAVKCPRHAIYDLKGILTPCR